MPLHALCIAARQYLCGTDAPCRTNGAKYPNGFGALIFFGYRPCASPGPSAGDTVFLANPGFILEPDFQWHILPDSFLYPGYVIWEVFLNAFMASWFCP